MSIESLINDPNTIMEVGDFRDLNDTNIDPEEAMQIGYMLGNNEFNLKKKTRDLVNEAKSYNKPKKGQKKMVYKVQKKYKLQ